MAVLIDHIPVLRVANITIWLRRNDMSQFLVGSHGDSAGTGRRAIVIWEDLTPSQQAELRALSVESQGQYRDI